MGNILTETFILLFNILASFPQTSAKSFTRTPENWPLWHVFACKAVLYINFNPVSPK